MIEDIKNDYDESNMLLLLYYEYDLVGL
jgi:hypothetical protein